MCLNKFSKKITRIYVVLFAAFMFFAGMQTVYAAQSLKSVEATRAVTNNPSAETISVFVKEMMKEYKKAYRQCDYDGAADYLRAALYFLKQKPDSKEYLSAYEKYGNLMEKSDCDMSQYNRLEIAKNLYLEKKYFASAYELSNLIKEGYEVDVCYEYMGDIAKQINSDTVAFEFYKKALEVNPDNLNAKYKFANALLKNNKANDAIYYFEEVLEGTNSDNVINEIITTFTSRLQENPNDENNYGVLGLAYQKLGQYDKTYKLLKRSLILNPNDIFLRYYLGNLLFEIKEFGFADEVYTEILEENPYESQIRISRAKTYGAKRDEAKAIKDYQIVLAMYPDSLQAQYGLYSLLANKLEMDKIVNLFYPLEKNYKLDDEGYNNLGYFANKMGNTKDAVKFFEKSLSINPKSDITYIELYKGYQVLGNEEKARNILKTAYKLFPKNSEIIEMYSGLNSDKVDEKNSVALSYLNEGDYKKAIAVYQQIEPKKFETYEALGNCYRQLGDFKNAVASYKKAIELNPDNSDVYYALGVTYLESNNQNKAKEAFITSVQKNGKNVKSKKMLSFIEQKEVVKSLDLAYEFYERKDYTTALRYLDKAVQTFPNDPKVYYYRGLTKEALNDFKGAVADFKSTVNADRNYVVAYYKMAESLERLNKKKEALYMYEKYLGAEKIDKDLAKKAEERVLELGERYY